MSNFKFTGYYKTVQPRPAVTAMADSQEIGDQGAYANYTFHQRLIQGSANRLTRYSEYDMADYDVEISRSLDTIAEEIIGNNPQDDIPLELVIHESQDAVPVLSSTVKALKAALKSWCSLHKLQTRAFSIARVTAKYGDCFFRKIQDTNTWQYCAPKNIIGAIVDQKNMTRVLGWQVRQNYLVPNSPFTANQTGMGMYNETNVDIVPAEDMVWFTLNDDMSDHAPFGESVLRAVYKAQKQKELLEDAVIIYRITRAPERRVIYVDTGKLPPARVKAHLEQVKNDFRQQRTPSTGGGADQVDSVYNPMSTTEDIFLATRENGGTKIDTLPGGASTGVIDDLEYFQWKVYRGLRIPLSYMREGSESASANDGNNPYVSELRFALFIQRIQRHLNSTYDAEFKEFLRKAGIKCDPTVFTIKLRDPENFGRYRQMALDADLLNVASTADGLSMMSKRMMLQKYLQWDQEDLLLNERLKFEEMGINPDSAEADISLIYGQAAPEDGMGELGGGMVAGGGMDDMGMDMGEEDALAGGEDLAAAAAAEADAPTAPAEA